jgi:hypothetical protein
MPDTLVSWCDTPTKTSILEFVAAVTDPDPDAFVPETDRGPLPGDQLSSAAIKKTTTLRNTIAPNVPSNAFARFARNPFGPSRSEPSPKVHAKTLVGTLHQDSARASSSTGPTRVG